MSPKTIESWVEYIQSLHVREIDLSLDRVKEVYLRLHPEGINYKVITVAGTNGKGSTSELLTSIYHSGGYSTAKYTSPHIESFNERFCINRQNVSDERLLAAFARVEHARQATRLTFFEFGTLLAIELFAQSNVDIAIMEVGLGGRLDAVNILDADVTIVTSISIDHTDWLGSSVDEIALEKIGVSRAEHPCVIGMNEPPETILEYCEQNSVPTYILGADFNFLFNQDDKQWCWQGNGKSYQSIPLPFSQSGVQLNNAACAIMAAEMSQEWLPISEVALTTGIGNAYLAARCQVVSDSPLIIVDVAHNEASVAELSKFIEGFSVTGKVYALCGMLKDKQIATSLKCMAPLIDEWSFVTIQHDRGSTAQSLATILESSVFSYHSSSDRSSLSNKSISFCYEDVSSAYNSISEKLSGNDALIVFGSFFIVGDIMRIIQS